ncbi:MAG: VCBS repeat-containing protein, partial [Candidatus Hydrogenedentes bacterium]|nr:VCBS repeat-containing protein [Candidatus Hydrogenedentota bacterium]
QDKMAPWLAYPMSHQMGVFAQFGHGLGMGDVNGDGRMDILSTEGWWEGPVDRTRPDWGFHQAHLGPACANMVVYDVDGDGHNDVITSSAHDYGIWWFEQRQENGATTFVQHEIDKGISQTHALILADINNDGLQDLITGKRYYAHCGHDPGCHEPAVLCWFELLRPEPGKFEYRKHEIDNDSGVGTQFQVCDVDGDGLLDVVTSNKKGVHLFLQRRSK